MKTYQKGRNCWQLSHDESGHNIVYMKRFVYGLTSNFMTNSRHYITTYANTWSQSLASYTLDRSGTLR